VEGSFCRCLRDHNGVKSCHSPHRGRETHSPRHKAGLADLFTVFPSAGAGGAFSHSLAPCIAETNLDWSFIGRPEPLAAAEHGSRSGDSLHYPRLSRLWEAGRGSPSGCAYSPENMAGVVRRVISKESITGEPPFSVLITCPYTRESAGPILSIYTPCPISPLFTTRGARVWRNDFGRRERDTCGSVPQPARTSQRPSRAQSVSRPTPLRRPPPYHFLIT
jgi:hypothetical protein